MFSNPEEFVDAYAKADGGLHTIPVNWLGSDSPFPGQFVKTKPAASAVEDPKPADGQKASN